MAPAARSDQAAPGWTIRNRFQNSFEINPGISAYPRGELPASDDDHLTTWDNDFAKLLEEISGTRALGVGAHGIGFIAVIRANERRKTGAERAAERPVRIGDLRLHRFGNGQGLSMSQFLQFMQKPLKSEMNGNCRYNPGPIVNPGVLEK